MSTLHSLGLKSGSERCGCKGIGLNTRADWMKRLQDKIEALQNKIEEGG
jgi:hypothetical protein